MRRRRIALVGLGAAARNIHLPAYRQLDAEIEVVGGCDPDPSARERTAREWGISTYTNAAEMLHVLRPDVAAVLTPPDRHGEGVAIALGEGCHVLCEKPVALDLEESDRMLAAAEEAGRWFVVNNQFRFLNIVRAAHRALGSGEAGGLLFARVTQTQQPHDDGEAGWRGRLERRVGTEFGVHVFDTLRFLFGCEPVRIFAHMPRPVAKVSTDAINVVVLEFPAGRSATIVLDRLSRGPERYLDLHLTAERGSIEASIGGQVRVALGVHTRSRRPFAELRWVAGGEARLRVGESSRLLARDPLNPLASATAANLRDMLRALDSGTEPESSGRRNRPSAVLVFKAYESAALGRPVDV